MALIQNRFLGILVIVLLKRNKKLWGQKYEKYKSVLPTRLYWVLLVYLIFLHKNFKCKFIVLQIVIELLLWILSDKIHSQGIVNWTVSYAKSITDYFKYSWSYMWFQMILDCITWPSSITVIFESYEDVGEDESCVTDVCRVSSYLKTFIENGMYDYCSRDVFEAFFFFSFLCCLTIASFLTQRLQLS